MKTIFNSFEVNKLHFENKTLLSLLLAAITWVLCIQSAFYFIQKNQSLTLSAAIKNQFREELQTSNFLYLSRTVSDLTHNQTIRCPLLKQLIENESLTILDLRSTDRCDSLRELALDGINVNQELATLNGQKYSFQYWTKNNGIFYLALWIFRISGLTIIVLGYLVLYLQKRASEIQIQKEREVALFRFEIARQLAHDIRSPLSAIKSTIPHLASTKSEAISLLREAADRVQEIANDLLEDTKNKIPSAQITTENHEKVFICQIINKIIKEKRATAPINLKIELDSTYEKENELTIRASEKEISRLISNILNNSVEASLAARRDCIQIDIFIRVYSKNIVVAISDNGSGMSNETIQQVMKGELVTTKEHGNGLGLFHARSYLISIGGDLQIQSRLGSGTIIQLQFPVS